MTIRLNPEQQAAVDYGDGPLMVLAGAGSGKTRVLVQRIARLVERGVSPRRILAVTFTNKAAGEMKERLAQTLGYAANDMWIGTFHGTCARLLRIFHTEAGLTPDYCIFDDEDQMRLVTALLKERKLKDQATPRGVLSAIGSAKNRGEDPIECNKMGPMATVIETIYPMYEAALKREDAVDFNDLLLRVRELFAHDEVGPKLKARFDHTLVDEFQDTNPVQFELVRGFVAETNNLTVVGDDDQSIYSWRGAEPRNLLDFKLAFPTAGEVKLEQNYRSTSIILRAANAVIANNRDRHPKCLWTEQNGGRGIHWQALPDERAEGVFVADSIEEIVASEEWGWGDIAILYRTHAQSRVLEERLLARRIDYRIVGGVSFFQRREIKDIRAYVRLVTNTAADSSFERIINVPPRGIGKTTVDHIRYYARDHERSFFDAAKDAVEGRIPEVRSGARKKLEAFVSIIESLQKLVQRSSVAELILQVVKRSGYDERLKLEGTPDAQDRLNNLGELVSMASDFDDEMDGEGTLVAFEERISLASTADSADGRGQVVTMMTVHAAKGLEFPVVFVVGLEDGLFPSLREQDWEFLRSEGRKELEEERRLAYVAFTRAKERLILSSAEVRRKWAEVKVNRPSRFLHEIPEDCIEEHTSPLRPVSPPSYQRRRARIQEDIDDFAFDQSAPFDDFPTYAVEDELRSEGGGAVAAGSVVNHPSFGTGTVLTCTGEGTGQKLLVDFAGPVGPKTVLASYVEAVR